MKTPIALDLTSIYMENDSEVLVVSREIRRYNKIL